MAGHTKVGPHTFYQRGHLLTLSPVLSGVLRKLLAELRRRGVITEDLCLPDSFDDLELVYRGLCRKGPSTPRRRIGGECDYLLFTFLLTPVLRQTSSQYLMSREAQLFCITP